MIPGQKAWAFQLLPFWRFQSHRQSQRPHSLLKEVFLKKKPHPMTCQRKYYQLIFSGLVPAGSPSSPCFLLLRFYPSFFLWKEYISWAVSGSLWTFGAVWSRPGVRTLKTSFGRVKLKKWGRFVDKFRSTHFHPEDAELCNKKTQKGWENMPKSQWPFSEANSFHSPVRGD